MFADLVFARGRAFVAGAARALDVAVRGDRLAAVGDVTGLIGPRTERIDLGGRLLIPGLQDAHAHPVWGGLEAMRCDLSDRRGLAGYLEKISSYAQAHRDREWVTGGGWSMSDFPAGTPHRCDLDRIVPDRPVLLHNCDHHGAWVNTAALRLAGVDRLTPDPADGRIERDADGSPSGVLHEGAVDLVAGHAPATSDADYEAALRLAQAHLHRLGITGWQDAIVGVYAGYRDPGPAYRALAGSGELTARVCGALWWDRTRGTEQIAELVERRRGNDIGRFHTPMVKIMLDGVAENFTAAMSEPYLGGHGNGLSFVDFARLPSFVTGLVAAGFGVHFHAIGDAAVRAALDAVAAPTRVDHELTDLFDGVSSPWDPDQHREGRAPRHQVAHLQVVDPVDVPRFAQLGVVPNMQALWACHEPQLDRLAIPFLGPERAAWLYPFGDLAKAGATLAAGSDWPVSSADPWQGIHVAVNRSYDDMRPLLPGQRLDLATALTAYTRGSALANGCPEAGEIAVGRLADLVVLDRDPFAGPVERIREVRVERTYVGGRRVDDLG